MWIGIDDTDSRKGGCTTYIATEIIKELEFNVIGYPRLVRLNPNIPWKTRGNGAISIKFGIGYGKKFEIGKMKNKKIFGYRYGKNVWNAREKIAARIDGIIKEKAEFDADPGIVILKKKPPYNLYKKAVREIVELPEIKKLLRKMDGIHISYKLGRGLIGATAAIAWKPRDMTYELLAYRLPNKWGTPREIDDESVIQMDKECGSTFDNYDYENHRSQISPNSPGPVLYGIRGEEIGELKKAKAIVKSEKIERWLIFETNQATDEHLQKKEIEKIKPYQSVITRGKVSSMPKSIEGGHIIFSIKDGKEMECAAYEPTKNFRKIVKKLCEGDIITIYGGIRKEPITINIEKMKVEKLIKIKKKVENPICECGKHMKSMGKGKGYRCSKCGRKAGENDAIMEEVERGIKPGFYEVPSSARRHLAKPLKRMKPN